MGVKKQKKGDTMRIAAVFCRCVGHVYRNRILDSEPFNCVESTFLKQVTVVKLGMKPPTSLRSMLKRHGYSDETVEAIWKWYNFHDRKGAASF